MAAGISSSLPGSAGVDECLRALHVERDARTGGDQPAAHLIVTGLDLVAADGLVHGVEIERRSGRHLIAAGDALRYPLPQRGGEVGGERRTVHRAPVEGLCHIEAVGLAVL